MPYRDPAAKKASNKRWNAANPDKRKACALKWYYANKDRAQANGKVWAAANPDKRRDIALRSRYGICLDDVKRLEVQQDFSCAICQKRKRLVVDHNHNTGQVRGLLCRKCNIAIGLLEDNQDLLRAAGEYLNGER